MDDLAREDVPGALAEALLDRERGIRTLLDDLDGLSLRGDHATVRERIRAFAATHERAFFAVAFALSGSEQFYVDVEAQMGVDTADTLRDLAETYPRLAEPFGLVRLEVAGDRHNPVTGVEIATTYAAEESVPLVEYALQSGELALYESRSSPQEVLGAATYLVGATNDALEAALSEDRPVNTDELSELIDRREELESELVLLQDRIDELRAAPGGDG